MKIFLHFKGSFEANVLAKKPFSSTLHFLFMFFFCDCYPSIICLIHLWLIHARLLPFLPSNQFYMSYHVCPWSMTSTFCFLELSLIQHFPFVLWDFSQYLFKRSFFLFFVLCIPMSELILHIHYTLYVLRLFSGYVYYISY